jgi:hypothetical protein
MPNIDLSRLRPPEYPNLISRWKTGASKRGSVNRNDLILGSETENAIIEFCLLQETQTLEVILRSVGHWIIWAVPTHDVPSDPSIAYDGFVRAAMEMEEELLARVHRRFSFDEWKHFVDLFSRSNL